MKFACFEHVPVYVAERCAQPNGSSLHARGSFPAEPWSVCSVNLSAACAVNFQSSLQISCLVVAAAPRNERDATGLTRDNVEDNEHLGNQTLQILLITNILSFCTLRLT